MCMFGAPMVARCRIVRVELAGRSYIRQERDPAVENLGSGRFDVPPSADRNHVVVLYSRSNLASLRDARTKRGPTRDSLVRTSLRDSAMYTIHQHQHTQLPNFHRRTTLPLNLDNY